MYNYNKFDAIYEERMRRNVRRLFNIVLNDIITIASFRIQEPTIIRRRSATFRSGDEFIECATIRILD